MALGAPSSESVPVAVCGVVWKGVLGVFSHGRAHAWFMFPSLPEMVLCCIHAQCSVNSRVRISAHA